MKRTICGILTVVFCAGLLVVSGCETQAQNKALIGGAVGAGAGQLIGRNTEGTLIGAGVGAGVGYLWGKSQDNKAKEEAAMTAPPRTTNTGTTDGTSATGTTMTMWVNNANGTRTEIKLTRNADGSYMGPGGKVYPMLPTQEQLQRDYGS